MPDSWAPPLSNADPWRGAGPSAERVHRQDEPRGAAAPTYPLCRRQPVSLISLSLSYKPRAPLKSFSSLRSRRCGPVSFGDEIKSVWHLRPGVAGLYFRRPGFSCSRSSLLAHSPFFPLRCWWLSGPRVGTLIAKNYPSFCQPLCILQGVHSSILLSPTCS